MSDFTAIMVDMQASDTDATSLSPSSSSSSAHSQHSSFVHEQRAIYASYQLQHDHHQQHDLDSLPPDLMAGAGASAAGSEQLQPSPHNHQVEVEPYRSLYMKKAHRAGGCIANGKPKKPRFVAPGARKPVSGERSALLEQFEHQQQQKALLMKCVAVAKVAKASRRKSAPVLCMDTLSSSTSAASMNWMFVLFVLSYAGYLVLGSVAFGQLEGDHELTERQLFRQVRQRFLLKYAEVADDDLEEFIRQVAHLQGHGVSPRQNATSADQNWSFGQALFFSSTLITTIGYGHITPLTQAGKLFCMLYAIVGIPLTLVLLSAAVERLLVPAGWLLAGLQSRFGHLYRPLNIRLCHLAVIVTIFGGLFMALPTVILTHLEPDWTTLDALYYCFITLTTIGLGDYIPGDQPEQANRTLYKVASAVYLIAGLVAAMLCLTVYYDIPQLNMGQLFSEHQSAAAAAAAKAGAASSAGGGSGSHTEATRLSLGGGVRSPMCYSSGGGPSGLYIPQRDDEARRSVVRIRPRGDESPSPDEERAPMLIGSDGVDGAVAQ